MIFFLYSWAFFLLFVDYSKIKRTVYGGIIASLTGILVDWAGHRLGFYRFHDGGLPWMVLSFLYTAGPLFTMGTIFFQYLTPRRDLQAGNIIVFSLSYLAAEVLLVMSGGASYKNWHYLASLATDLLFFTAFSYIGEKLLYRHSEKIRE